MSPQSKQTLAGLLTTWSNPVEFAALGWIHLTLVAVDESKMPYSVRLGITEEELMAQMK